MLFCNASRLVCGVCGLVRSLSTTSQRLGSNHYDALGITPKATQGDIKSAYYKLSKVYHPDKSNNVRFQSEATQWVDGAVPQFILHTNHYHVTDALGCRVADNIDFLKSLAQERSALWDETHRVIDFAAPHCTADEVAAKKFRAISEAYEVLGNIQLKKMYDKGLLGSRMPKVEYQPDPEPTDPTLKFYKSRIHRSAVPTMDGRQPIYDFDTWSKSHYGHLFEKSRYEKEFLRKKREKAMDVQHSNQQEKFLFIMFGIVSLFIFLVAQGTTDYDNDTTAYKLNDTNVTGLKE